MLGLEGSGTDLGRLVASLLEPQAFIELGVFLGCVLLAWVLVRLMRGRVRDRVSVLFGHSIVDGVLFPVLALIFAFLAHRLLLAEVPNAVFRVVLPILVSLVVIRLTVRVLRAAFPTSGFTQVIERSVSWIAWVAVVLWITGVLPVLLAELDGVRWTMGSAQISLRNLLEGVVSAFVVLFVALWISAALEARLLKNASDDLSIRKMAANVLRALLLFIGLMFALSAAGIDLTALGVLGGAVGVGIGFGLQKLASNYISGFVILAERSVRIGDMVKVDGFEGRITDIKTRYTMIRALGGRESIVPNEMLITQRVENSSQADPKMQLSCAVRVAYGTDIDMLRPRLEEAVRGVPRVLTDPAPEIQLQAFPAEGMELAVSFWIADVQTGQGNVRSDVNLAVWRTLGSLGIRIV